jgi:hypothetical protein
MPKDWAEYIPEKQRREAEQLRRRLRRKAKLMERRFWVRLCLVVYSVWCLILIASGNAFTFGLALVPALTLPAIGWLAYWLVYKEFHH